MVYNKIFSCKITLAILRRLLEHTFACDEGNYYLWEKSTWAAWVKRIEKGHDEEVAAFKRQQKKWEAEGYHIDACFEYGKAVVQEHLPMCLLTNSMYAALVVSLWAEVESYLKSLVKICSVALKKKKNARYQFNDIKEFFKNELKIDFEKFGSYKTINAIRILNNSFKHSHGNYKPTDKAYMQIDATLLKVWNIISKDGKIKYSKLPMKDLVLVCGQFNKSLIQEVEQKLIAVIEKTGIAKGRSKWRKKR